MDIECNVMNGFYQAEATLLTFKKTNFIACQFSKVFTKFKIEIKTEWNAGRDFKSFQKPTDFLFTFLSVLNTFFSGIFLPNLFVSNLLYLKNDYVIYESTLAWVLWAFRIVGYVFQSWKAMSREKHIFIFLLVCYATNVAFRDYLGPFGLRRGERFNFSSK